MTRDGGNGIRLPEEREPDWMPQLRDIAARLGVSPVTDSNRAFLVGYNDELYDIGALLLGMLDRLDVIR